MPISIKNVSLTSSTLAVIALTGCAGPSALENISLGDKKITSWQCADAIWNYSSAILNRQLESDEKADEITQAVKKIKSGAPICTVDRNSVVKEIADAVGYLSRMKSRETEAYELANLALEIADNAPDAGVGSWAIDTILGVAVKRNDSILAKKAIDTALTRGLWSADNQYGLWVDGYFSGEKEKLLTPQLSSRIRNRKQILGKAQAEAMEKSGYSCKKYWESNLGGFSSESATCLNAYAQALANNGLKPQADIVYGVTRMALAMSAQVRKEMDARQAADSQLSNNMLGTLSALAKGVSMAGGKNAAQLDMLGDILQGKTVSPSQMASLASASNQAKSNSSKAGARASGPVNESESSRIYPVQQAVATPAPQSSSNNNVNKDPFTYSNATSSCVILEKNPSQATINRWRNQCSFTVNITFCEIKSDRNECAAHITGGAKLAPNQSDYILNTVKNIKWIACQDPYYIPSSKLTWNGTEFNGKCQKNL